MSKLSGLYYPFSRCINAASLKQLLLVFDEVGFVDSVDDDKWRAKLLENLESHDETFHKYKDVEPHLAGLFKDGCIKRIDPAPFTSGDRSLAALSAISDLKDKEWASLASNPQKFDMPSIRMQGQPSWQVFRPKLPDRFLNSLKESRPLRRHLIVESEEWQASSLSYAAGSAICIAVHLDIADNLRLAPVTDSELHHRLLLMKLERGLRVTDAPEALPEQASQHLTVDIATTMLSSVLPPDRLATVSFEDIVDFRARTQHIRSEFIADIENRVGQLRTVPNAQEWISAARLVKTELGNELQKYQAEFSAARDRMWPKLIKSLNSTLTGGGLGAVLLALTGTPHGVLLGAITGAALTAANAVFDFSAERKKVERSQAPSLAYLSRVTSKFR